MRGIVMAYAVAAAMVAWTAAVAQNNPNQPSPPGGGSAQTTGQGNNPGQTIREAPVGHRQPKAKDVPSGIQDNYGVRSREEQDIDRKLRICRDC